MTAAIEAITGDGTVHDLDAHCSRGVGDPSGMFAVPAKRGADLVVPGQHGELHLPGKRYGAANLVLRQWVRGVNPDGTVPADGTAARLVFTQSLRALLGIFTLDEQVTLRHTLSDGTARQITGEVVGSVEPQLTGRDRYSLGQFSVALRCADPFWTDLADVSQVVTKGGPVTLTAFAGASAPMEDLQLVFGPQPNPRLEQPSTGVFVRLDRVISSGQTITVETGPIADRKGWLVYGSPGVAGGLYEDLAYGGRGTARWFALRPEPGGGAPVVELTNTGGAGQVTVLGRRRYKIG